VITSTKEDRGADFYEAVQMMSKELVNMAPSLAIDNQRHVGTAKVKPIHYFSLRMPSRYQASDFSYVLLSQFRRNTISTDRNRLKRITASFWRSQRFFRCPFIQTSFEGVSGYIKFGSPPLKAHRPTLKSDIAVSTRVAHLLDLCCPAHVARLVVSVIVGIAINGMFQRRSLPNVSKEVFKDTPSLTYLYSFIVVMLRAKVVWLNSHHHVLPALIGWRGALSGRMSVFKRASTSVAGVRFRDGSIAIGHLSLLNRFDGLGRSGFSESLRPSF
jgi:hypothetical protein